MNTQPPLPDERKQIAHQIFAAALAAADPVAAVERAVTVDGQTISIAGFGVTSSDAPRNVFAVAIGKAALTMASGLDQGLGSALRAGAAVGLTPEAGQRSAQLPDRWTVLNGGHPLPNENSFHAGRVLVEFVQKLDRPNSALIFLISGGGSALVELPVDPRITVQDLAAVNSLVLANSVPIREVNVVRRALSAIKGGGLVRYAPLALKIGLIVSDTNPKDEGSVASGPTFPVPTTGPTAADVLRRHALWDRASPVVREMLSAQRPAIVADAASELVRNHVLLSSDDALAGAATAARELGFQVILADDICEQEISAGCRALVERFRAPELTRPVCLLSAGEFRTPVAGTGRGGRSTETALRLAITLTDGSGSPTVFTGMLAGTDGIDGNCPAAGGVIDERTLLRANSLGLDPQKYLVHSDSYSFFDSLGDAVVTGPTGTNVRDLRIVLGWP